MRLLEHEAKQLLSEIGIPIPREAVVASPDEAAEFVRTLNTPVVIKAQIPIGGRAKAGGVLFASSPDAVARATEKLLGATIRGYVVERVSVQEQIKERGKFYLAATFDSRERRAVLLASVEGGIDIEESHHVLRQAFSLRQPYPLFRARELATQLLNARAVWADLRVSPTTGAHTTGAHTTGAHTTGAHTTGAHTGAPLQALTDIIHKLARFFQQHDALLVEINPLLSVSNYQLPITNPFVAVDARIELEDDALYRHKNLVARFGLAGRGERPHTPLEQRAAEIDGADHRGVAGRVVEFDGDLALLIGGGGASLTVFDAILDAGGKPANYCEIGGNPSVWKTAELTKLLLSKPGVTRLAVIMNVVNNTRADLMARGVIKGIIESGREPKEVIAAFRIPGSWEEESVKILQKYGVRYFGREVSLNEVAEFVVNSEQRAVNIEP